MKICPTQYAPASGAQEALLLGADSGVQVFDGLLDESEIFDRPLEDVEITTIGVATSSGKCRFDCAMKSAGDFSYLGQYAPLYPKDLSRGRFIAATLVGSARRPRERAGLRSRSSAIDRSRYGYGPDLSPGMYNRRAALRLGHGTRGCELPGGTLLCGLRGYGHDHRSTAVLYRQAQRPTG